ncbi:hypothetical protein AAEX63_05185 [Luteococcus sp. H138]|uniref:hypothetical protein n=1 Tax=Luteococcus sp. H91 TaxID=3139401 RepID=UPI00313B8C2F
MLSIVQVLSGPAFGRSTAVDDWASIHGQRRTVKLTFTTTALDAAQDLRLHAAGWALAE